MSHLGNNDSNDNFIEIRTTVILTLFKMGLLGAAHGWVDQKGTPFIKSVTHILQWWNWAQLYLT